MRGGSIVPGVISKRLFFVRVIFLQAPFNDLSMPFLLGDESKGLIFSAVLPIVGNVKAIAKLLNKTVSAEAFSFLTDRYVDGTST